MDIGDFLKLDSATKLEQLIKDSEFVSKLKSKEIYEILMSLNENDKIKILRNIEFMKKNKIVKKSYIIVDLFENLGDEAKRELLLDKDLIKKELNLIDWVIEQILGSCSAQTIISILTQEVYNFDNERIENILCYLGIDILADFFKEYKEFLSNKGVKPYSIIRKFNENAQLEFVSKLEGTGLNLEEKREILVVLCEEAKDSIDKSNLPPEYLTALEMQISDKDDQTHGYIIVDFNKDLEIYRGLDELIVINFINITCGDKRKLLELYEICPEIRIIIDFNRNLEIYRGLDNWININPTCCTDEMQDKIIELCDICPNMNIFDNIGFSATVEEYKNAEVWIESILQGINPDWTDIQKIAYIDNKMGKEITYCPYFDTEIYDFREIQNIWKVANKKTGVCWGISELEKYIFSKIGIDAEVIIDDNDTHAFLKLKDIEIPTSDGNIIKGDTILDSTWNLVNNRFGSMPNNFCKSYEEIRKHDIIESESKDTESHKNNSALASATLDLDEKGVKEIFTSIGVADKDGNFPIKKLKEKSKTIDDYNFPTEEAIKYQFQLLADYYPEFATCQNETMTILSLIILKGENLNFNRCVANRVYERDDENKQPVLYVYADLPEVGKRFYFADKETKSFVELPEKEFEQKFECYQKDLEKQNGHRPWEDIEESQEHLSKNSIPAKAKNIGGR